MAKRHPKSHKSQTKVPELIIVTFAENSEQAKEYETLLESNGIPVTIKEQNDDEGTKGIAIMVPEDYIDEAHVVIESQDAFDDFYDFALEDEEESDFDGQLFDDDF